MKITYADWVDLHYIHHQINKAKPFDEFLLNTYHITDVITTEEGYELIFEDPKHETFFSLNRPNHYDPLHQAVSISAFYAPYVPIVKV